MQSPIGSPVESVAYIMSSRILRLYFGTKEALRIHFNSRKTSFVNINLNFIFISKIKKPRFQ